MPISMHAMSQDDVEAFAILPSSPSDHNGVIDLVLNSNTGPYNIKYFKDDGTGIFNLVYEITATENGAGEDFESASLGNYRIEIQDNYCGAIVLNVTLSLECNCTVPILNFDASQCVLTWDEVCNELGQGFEYQLQYLVNGVWQNVVTSALIHYPQTDGDYRLRIFKENCVEVVSSVVEVNCGSTSTQCTCTVPSLDYSAEACWLSWQPLSCSGFNAILQKKNNLGTWIDIPNATSPFTLASNGEYRLHLLKPGCASTFSNSIIASCISNPCNCNSPLLSYNDNACQLFWDNNVCEGYTIELYQLSNTSTWSLVAFEPISPYTPPGNGTYKLVLSKPNCSNVESSPVTGVCNNTSCECSDPVLIYDDNECQLSWSNSNCTGYFVTLQKFSNGIWVDISNSSPYIIGSTSNGFYRLVATKDGCEEKSSSIVSVTCSCQSIAAIDAHYLAGSGQGSVFSVPANGNATIFLSQLIPVGCSSNILKIGFPVAQVDVSWSFTGSNIGINVEGASGPYFELGLEIPLDPNNNQGLVYVQNTCGDVYTLVIINDCCINANLVGDVTRGCGALSLDVVNGTPPYTYNISGVGSDGTSITQYSSNIDLTALQPGEEINLQIVISDMTGCTIEFPATFKKCSFTCVTAPDGSEICECFNMDGIGFSEQTCSVTGYAVGCEPDGNIHIYNSDGTLIGSVSMENYEASLSQMDDIILANGNDDLVIIGECECGYSAPFNLSVNCVGSKFNALDNVNLKNFSFYPNPFSAGLFIKGVLYSNENITMDVYNSLGLLAFSKSLKLQQGQNIYYIEEFELYPSGLYTVQLKNEKFKVLHKVVKIE